MKRRYMIVMMSALAGVGAAGGDAGKAGAPEAEKERLKSVPVVIHNGSANPGAQEGWKRTGGVVRLPEKEINGIGGYRAWNINDNSAAQGSTLAYSHALTDDEKQAAAKKGWVMKARVEVVGNADAPDGSIHVMFSNDAPGMNRGFALSFGSTAEGGTVVSMLGGEDVVLSDNAKIHLYEVRYDPETKAADLYVDHELKVSGWKGVPACGNKIQWGSDQSDSSGNANYSLVSLEIAGYEKKTASLNYAKDRRDTVVYAKEGVYACFPDLLTMPDGRLTARFGTRVRASHVDGEGGTKVMVSADGGHTWEDTEDSWISRMWLKKDGRMVTADAGGWEHVPAERGAELNAARKVVVPVKEGVVAYLKDAYYEVSLDHGKTWEKTLLQHGEIIGSMNYNKAACELVTSGGTHLVAVYGKRYRDVPGKPLLDQMEVFFLRSADDGKTWDIILQVPDGMDRHAHPSRGLNETALVENDQGEIVALSRTQKDAHKMFLSFSKDDGLTWSNPVDSGMFGLPPQLLKLKDGRILCTYGRRYAPTGIFGRISNDGGHTWLEEEEIVINDQFPGNPNDNGYPISVQLDDGSIFTIYYKAGSDGVIAYIGGTHWRID